MSNQDQMFGNNQVPQGFIKFKYRVIYCSGEDPEFPVTELLDPSVNSRGWQSQKFCQYPQEIILQFASVVNLKQLQFLSHQSKISSKIELYTYNPQTNQTKSNQIPLNEIQFKKLGYLTLDPNERSNFQARELKSVSIDVNAALLKLIFHKNHGNNFNVFNQIGLIALNCIGPQQAISQEPNRGATPQKNSVRQQMNSTPQGQFQFGAASQDNMGFYDPDTQNKIRQLEVDKQLAVNNENFELAKHLKMQIDRLKAVGIQLQNLESQKQIAIQSDNFDEAKRIKIQMEQIKYTAMMHANANQTPLPQQQIQQMPQQQMPFIRREADVQVFGKSQNHFNDVIVEPLRNQQQTPSQRNLPMSPIIDGVSKLMTDKQREIYNQQYLQHSQDNSLEYENEQPPFQRINSAISRQQSQRQDHNDFMQPDWNQVQSKPFNVDDQVIPALNKNSNKNQPQPYAPGEEFNEEEFKDGEPIPNGLMPVAQSLIEAFGEPPVRKIFSRTWALREQGLTEIEELITAQRDNKYQSENFVQGITAVKITIGDKIIGVCQKAIQFLTTLLNNFPNVKLNANQVSQVQGNAEPILLALIEKLGDNLQKIRVSAEDAIISLCFHPQFGSKICIQNITRPARKEPDRGANQKKTMNSNKQIVGKYATLARILAEQSIKIEQPMYKEILKFSLVGIQHNLQDVRQQATKCIVELYKTMGDTIRSSFGDLRPAQVDAIDAAIAESNPGMKRGGAQKEEPQVVIQTNIDPQWHKKQKEKKRNEEEIVQKPKQSVEYGNEEEQFQEDDKICNFCGTYDENFNQESIDIHYWKECPMLTTCWECEQVIEISCMNEHLIEECQNSDKYKFCNDCKQVILKEDFQGHVCTRPKPAGAVKCPLCTLSVFPKSIGGWKKHILQDRCAGNARLPPQ